MAGAYHSRLMEPARAAFAAYLETIPLAAPRFPVFSNTTALPVATGPAIKAALARQIVSPVLWEDLVRAPPPRRRARPNSGSSARAGVLAGGLARRIDKAWTVKSFSEFSDLAA